MRISDWSSDVCSSDLFVPGEERKAFCFWSFVPAERGGKIPADSSSPGTDIFFPYSFSEFPIQKSFQELQGGSMIEYLGANISTSGPGRSNDHGYPDRKSVV